MYYPEVFNATISFVAEWASIDIAQTRLLVNATVDCLLANATIGECWTQQYDTFAPIMLPLRDAPFDILLLVVAILLIAFVGMVGGGLACVGYMFFHMIIVMIWIFLIFPVLVGVHVVQWTKQKLRGPPLPPPPQPPLQAAVHNGLILAARTAG